jgi:hypothetical protein
MLTDTGRPTALLLLAAVIAYALFFYRDCCSSSASPSSAISTRSTWRSTMSYARCRSTTGRRWTPYQVLGKRSRRAHQRRVLPVQLGARHSWRLAPSLALHHVWAATGMYCLLRHRDLSPLAAAFGGLLFGFGGLFVAFDNMINALQSAAWAPWTLLAFDIWCERPTFTALAGVAVGLAMTLLGGMPEVLFFENVLFAALAIDRHATTGQPSLARAALACPPANGLPSASAPAAVPHRRVPAQLSRAGAAPTR